MSETIEVIEYYNKDAWLALRAKDITSTDCAALFGVSPYSTLYELWYRKRNKTIVEFEENDRMKWGTRLQDSIAHGVAEDNGWIVRRMDEYLRIPELRIGSSFDFSIDNDGILEIKNVDVFAYKNGWIVDGENVEAPLHIELQLQHQLLVSGRSYGYIAALIGGNRVVLIRRERDEKVIAGIKKKVAAFWKSIDEDKPPTPDFAKDSDTIAKVYGYAEPNKLMRAEEDMDLLELAEQYDALGKIERDADKRRKELKAKILMHIGDAERVIGDRYTISCGMIGPTSYAVEKQGYRNFMLHFNNKEKS